MSKHFLVFILAVFSIFAISEISSVNGHSLFNSAEQTIGNNRVQIATLPEFPQIGEESTILFRITDRDYNEVERFTMGVRIFFNDEQITAFRPEVHEGSHWETSFVFEHPGNHIVKVDLYDVEGQDSVITYTFNMSTQSPFGYIFFVSITIGATVFAIVIGYIYLPRIIRSKFRP